MYVLGLGVLGLVQFGSLFNILRYSSLDICLETFITFDFFLIYYLRL